jgi:RecG-like helicase
MDASVLGRTLRRLTESGSERALRESRIDHERRHPGEELTPIDTCCPGQQVTVTGTISTLEVRPEGSAPALEVSLNDGSGRLFVVWLGRRRIPGVYEGRRLVVHGRLNCVTEHPTIYNPRYELLPE